MPSDLRVKKHGLPVAHLADEVHVACERKTWHALSGRLKAAAPNEGCAFGLTRTSRGKDRVTVILREILWPQPGEVETSPDRLEITADYISRVLDAAIDAGDRAGIALIHTHPDTVYGTGIGQFSPRDDWYEERLFPSAMQDRPLTISASIVLGSKTGSLDARIWWNEGGLKTQPANVVRIVGPEIDFLETPHSFWRDHPDPGSMDRSTRLWGKQGRRRLQNLRAGIVGAGGTGSITLLALATMGTGKIRIWDKDLIKKENLHRMLGATAAMVGQPKVEALSEYARSVTTATPFEIQPIIDWGTSEQSLKGLKDCDVIFSCVDKFAPRVPLNALAYSHLIPVIDVASWIHPNDDGIVDAILTHAHVLSPGIPCAWCRGTISSRRLTREAQGRQRDAEMRIPYGLRLDQTDGVEPSVLPLNMAGVGLVLMEFMQVALKITNRTPRDLKLILPEWELDESDLDCLSDCECKTEVGLGDDKRIRPVEFMI